jgi:hypothetical protein
LRRSRPYLPCLPLKAAERSLKDDDQQDDEKNEAADSDIHMMLPCWIHH